MLDLELRSLDARLVDVIRQLATFTWVGLLYMHNDNMFRQCTIPVTANPKPNEGSRNMKKGKLGPGSTMRRRR